MATQVHLRATRAWNHARKIEPARACKSLSPFAQEIEAFADYVLEGVEGPTSGVMERRSLAIVQAGYESAASGEVVDLWERFGVL